MRQIFKDRVDQILCIISLQRRNRNDLRKIQLFSVCIDKSQDFFSFYRIRLIDDKYDGRFGLFQLFDRRRLSPAPIKVDGSTSHRITSTSDSVCCATFTM